MKVFIWSLCFLKQKVENQTQAPTVNAPGLASPIQILQQYLWPDSNTVHITTVCESRTVKGLINSDDTKCDGLNHFTVF